MAGWHRGLRHSAWRGGWLVVAATGICAAGAAQPAAAQAAPTFTSAQASGGEALYAQNCASCHGAQLNDGRFGPPLRGGDFDGHWGGRSLSELFDFLKGSMPPGHAGSLGDNAYGQLIAFLLAQNGAAAGQTALVADSRALAGQHFPGAQAVP
ncbi:MAG: c-type cytochrome, partial [Steroidobacteraceae bacterium]